MSWSSWPSFNSRPDNFAPLNLSSRPNSYATILYNNIITIDSPSFIGSAAAMTAPWRSLKVLGRAPRVKLILILVSNAMLHLNDLYSVTFGPIVLVI